ncbi:hypothetical protein [Streptomyces fuscichromogenes]|uniref:Uncharacterized protein n=1 Tax=Streptomyces fuscichromogenes TaxID=1324013 RepID=A0A917XJ31_9ACTN|nr:hypothetical protein [Streptomyces fuscichromogenes]GGN32009.1 hypothetical protein GCM10011578_070380 [Streptomyces fuscichromogenes]
MPPYAPDAVELTLPAPEGRRRPVLLADVYGLSDGERAALSAAAAARLRSLVEWMHAEAEAGHPAFAGHIADRHGRRSLTDARWIETTFLLDADSR